MKLLLFALDDGLTAAAEDAGIDAVVVDLEQRGKRLRQTGFDTSISAHTIADVARVRALTGLPVVVRVDAPDATLAERMAAAVDAGADELLVPMVADAVEVADVLAVAPPGARVGVLVERQRAVADAAVIARLGVARVFLGLMDLMVERGASSPFEAVVDGTVADVRAAVGGAFGFGGLTVPGGGHPVPVELLAAALVDHGADFTFLRRSFLADVADAAALPSAVASVRSMVAGVRARDPGRIAADRRAFAAAVQCTVGAP